MKVNLLFVLILLMMLTQTCSVQNHNPKLCNEELVLELSKERIEKKIGGNMDWWNRTISEDSAYFYINYIPKDSTSLGGGGKFIISKINCEIVSEVLYQ